MGVGGYVGVGRRCGCGCGRVSVRVWAGLGVRLLVSVRVGVGVVCGRMGSSVCVGFGAFFFFSSFFFFSFKSLKTAKSKLPKTLGGVFVVLSFFFG